MAHVEERWNADGYTTWCVVENNIYYPFGSFEFSKQGAECIANEINTGNRTAQGLTSFGGYTYKCDIRGLKVEQIHLDSGLSVWCIVQNDKKYAFGSKETAEACLERILEGRESIHYYEYVGQSRIEDEIAEWPEVAAVPLPEFSPWRCVYSELPESSEESKVSEPELQQVDTVRWFSASPSDYREFSPSGELLLRPLQRPQDSRGNDFRSECANCGFTQVSYQYIYTCPQCSRTYFYYSPRDGSRPV